MKKNKVYLNNYSLDEAMEIFLNKLSSEITYEEINTEESCGRITYDSVYAKLSSPFYNSSAMDGIAVESSKTFAASENNVIELHKEDYLVVDTGDPIPSKYDAVIMVEDLIEESDGVIKLIKSVTPWQNIRPLGEDIVESQLILPSFHKIRAIDIGALLAGGINKLKVVKKPVVGIIPTGTEIVEPGSELKIGDIIEFNSRVFLAQINEYGGIGKRYDIVKDNIEEIKEVVSRAISECDMVIVNAGSSAGREDFTAKIIKELGQVYVHGVTIKPGKPVILGKINNKPIIGIPGYPVSAYFVMENVVRKVLGDLFGIYSEKNITVRATLSRRVLSSLKYHEFVRVKLGFIADKYVATPLSRGAGATMSLVRADGVLEVSQSIEGIEAGTEIDVKLINEENKIKNTLVSIGSHDPIMDILADVMQHKNKNCYLSSAHVGSFGGIMALKNNEAHIAPIHLLDMEDGRYNSSYIKKYLPDKEMCLIKGVKRIQGFIVPPGNPKNITTINDLVNKNIKFINRQRGAGTRMLLDYLLNNNSIRPDNISGYYREEYTHLAVAATVANGDVDCGLGVYSAAQIMGLDFIEVCSEEYDFAISREFLNLEIVQEFIRTLQSEVFHRELDRLGGYDYKQCGEIVYV